jgi:hypothetical protein
MKKKHIYNLRKSIENKIKDYILDDFVYSWERNGRKIRQDTLQRTMDGIMVVIKDFLSVHLDISMKEME